MVLRQEVFIVEQDCPYLDADSKDQESHHILGTDSEGNIHVWENFEQTEIIMNAHIKAISDI